MIKVQQDKQCKRTPMEKNKQNKLDSAANQYIILDFKNY